MFSINTINRVNFRKDSGLWVYDDAKFGVREQPLVFGMDLILEKMVEQVEGVVDRLNLVFFYLESSGRVSLWNSTTHMWQLVLVRSILL